MTITPAQHIIDAAAKLDPKAAAAEADSYIEILPDVTAILAAAHAGEAANAAARAELLGAYLVARIAAIRAAHPTLEAAA